VEDVQNELPPYPFNLTVAHAPETIEIGSNDFTVRNFVKLYVLKYIIRLRMEQ